MADYYPLIARAIAGLDPNAPGEARRALYERARSALIAQLRSVDPPLSESEITRERLSLEEAVRKVESEAAQRARDARAGGDTTRPAGAPRAGDAFRAATRPGGSRPADAAPSQPSGPQAQAMLSQTPPRSRTAPSARGLRADPPPISSRPQPQDLDQDAPPFPPRERPGAPRRGADNGLSSPPGGIRGFRDIAADADDLGRAAAQANRAARKTYANVPSSSPEFDRLEPGLEDRGNPDDPYSYDDGAEEAERYAPAGSRSRLSQDRDKGRARGFAFPYKIVSALGILLILIGAGILWGKPALNAFSGMFKSSTQIAEAPKDNSAPASQPKIPDRVGQPSSSDQTAPVAQRVVLYDEDPSDPKGKQYVGTVVWRTEPVKAGNGQPADIAVRADIDIPDRKFKMTMSFRRNTDTSLPASHTAELTFILPPDFDGGGVSNVPGILMKSNEQARGTPLAGLAVKVTDGFFLVGLSNVDSDRARNIQLLKERSWFDVPLVYVNQRRAIIAIEKGPPGERAFNEAFAAWGE
ncbi:MAG TPA: hypothetical protein VHB49_01830 [Bradyrhizobium sp.]|nr:hypothetical protein [Bradyrhizobium sp.]